VTVRIPVTTETAVVVERAVARARELAASTDRPPVAADDHRCLRCSLAPVCLPEEARFAAALEGGCADQRAAAPIRLYPADSERRSLHVVTQGARVGRAAGTLTVGGPDGGRTEVGVQEVSDVVLHGNVQVTTQALRLCADEGIPLHWVTSTGAPIGFFASTPRGVQRRLRQYRALADPQVALGLGRRLIAAKVENELRHVLRASRKEPGLRLTVAAAIEEVRAGLRGAVRAEERGVLLGHEGRAAKAYFAAIADLVDDGVDPNLRPSGRSRRPPTDRFNALLSFCYSLLYRDVVGAILRVGLEPAIGFLHQPRGSAFPLALDLMELFRTPLVDVAVLAAVNRRTFDPAGDFSVTGRQVWMSDEGRRKLIGVYERRKHEEYRHPAVGYSLSFGRLIELEVRLLEKEWSGEAGLFARLRIR
jgi:CRISPR-associated protein Cas1